MIDIWVNFSLAFLYKTAPEKVKDAKSLAGSWKVLKGIDAKKGSRNIRITLRSLYALDKVLWRSFEEIDASLVKFARQFTRCGLALIFSFLANLA